MITTKTLKNNTERLDRVYRLMETVGLAERFINSYPHELDGGRRQRIGIARACPWTRSSSSATSRCPRWTCPSRLRS